MTNISQNIEIIKNKTLTGCHFSVRLYDGKARRAGERGWQTRANSILRKGVGL